MVAGRPFLGLLTSSGGISGRRVGAPRGAVQHTRGMAGWAWSSTRSPSSICIRQDVVEAYYDVAKAMEERDQRINLAKEQATKAGGGRGCRQNRLRRQGRQGGEGAGSPQGSGADFWRFYSSAAPGIEPRRRVAIGDVGSERSVRRPIGAGGRQMSRIARPCLRYKQGLVDYRHYWNSATKALSGRDLLLIDSDKVKGRRSLMLFDPDVFRVPFPVMMPQGARAGHSCRRGAQDDDVDRLPYRAAAKRQSLGAAPRQGQAARIEDFTHETLHLCRRSSSSPHHRRTAIAIHRQCGRVCVRHRSRPAHGDAVGADGVNGAGRKIGWPWPIPQVQHFDHARFAAIRSARIRHLARTIRKARYTIDKILVLEAYVSWKIADQDAVDAFVQSIGSIDNARPILRAASIASSAHHRAEAHGRSGQHRPRSEDGPQARRCHRRRAARTASG